NGNPGEGWVAVGTTDTMPPTVRITGDSTISIPGQGPANSATLRTLRGTAEDAQSGVKSVEWRLDGGPFVSVDDRSGTGWRVEEVSLPLGVHLIEVRATDHAGNTSDVKKLEVAVTEEYRPKDPTVHEYLTALVDFVVKRFRHGSAPVDEKLLERVFAQPFARLLGANRAAPTPQVAQLRVCLEAVRAYFWAVVASLPSDGADSLMPGAPAVPAVEQPPSPGPLPIPQRPPVQEATQKWSDAVQTYLRTAYEGVLRRIGTSVEELVAALDGGDPDRLVSLADRLGIELAPRKSTDGTVGTTLDPLRLTGAEITEEALERVFGLPSFQRDPLTPLDREPYLLERQLNRLTSQFRLQDDLLTEPLVDPDVITVDDLRPGTNAAEPLLQARQVWLDGLLAELRRDPGGPSGPVPVPQDPPVPQPPPPADQAVPVDRSRGAREAAADPGSRFDDILTRYVAPPRSLLDLEASHQAGESIAAELDAVQLTFAAFDRLLRLRVLAGAGAITEVGWDDVYAIVVGVQKRRLRTQWRQVERGVGVHVGPAFFRITGEPRPGPAVSPWRAEATTRRRWLNSLRGRIEQLGAARAAYAAAIAGVEQDALPQLRDGMLLALSTITSHTASTLSDLLLVDVMADGSTRITRREQAIQTLQSLILGVRLGTAEGWSRAGNEDEATFDEELRWIGSYANWYSAMQVFLFPENQLSPVLRPNPEDDDPNTGWSEEFEDLVDDLRRTRPLTADAVADIVDRWPKDSQQAELRVRRTWQELTGWRFQCWSAIGTLPSTATATARLERLRAISRHVRERYYDAPLAIALALHRAGQYLAALDWFRMVYQYDLPAGIGRANWYGLVLEADPTPPNEPLLYERNVFWLAKELNPHEIVDASYQDAASARWDVHTRFVVHSIVRCLLDFADAEFVQDTNESLPRARSLYLEALGLLALPALNPAEVPELSPNEVTTTLRHR
ncbi:MAG: OmpL47-type beta-barrel domain-containing protein, partial [Dermatophilaceae bacterium]